MLILFICSLVTFIYREQVHRIFYIQLNSGREYQLKYDLKTINNKALILIPIYSLKNNYVENCPQNLNIHSNNHLEASSAFI